MRKCPDKAYKCKLMLRLLAGEHCLETNTVRHKSKCEFLNTVCTLCNNHAEADLPHMLFLCESLREHRMLLLARLSESCPTPLQKSWNNMSPSERTQFILSGFRISFTVEWINMYHTALRFVTNMYLIRKQQCT